MITYTRQADGTYLKAGAFSAVPAEVRIQVNDAKPFAGSYTLKQAEAIIEDAIAKGQVQKERYAILPPEEKLAKEPKAPKAPKEPKAPKAPKEPKPAKEPKANKYSADDFVRIYTVNHSLDEVCTQTGASRVWAQRVLVKRGVWVAPTKAVKPEVQLTEQEEARIAAILAAPDAPQGTDRKSAIKQLRKEQRIAARPPKAAAVPKENKYSKATFLEVYAKNHSLDEVCTVTGASRVWAQRVLVREGVWVKPVKAAVEAPVALEVEPTPAPVVEPVATEQAPAAQPKGKKAKKEKAAPAPKPAPAEKPKSAKKKKSAPNQEVPPVEPTA